MTDQTILIAYFSHSGNTRVIADHVKAIAGGDLFEIVTVEKYPTDYDAVVEVAGREQKKGARPELSSQVANLASIGVIFVGYPNWWGTMPMAVFSFLEKHDYSGKKIAPFCTHEGSALGRSMNDFRKLCPRSEILDGLAIRGGQAKSAKKDVEAWLKRIGIV
jgi:flavodoxin